MTKDLKTIDLNSLPIESVTVQLRELFDDCEQTLRVVESIPPDEWKRVQNFGRMLARARQLTPHGEWTDYITDTFAGRLTMRVAQRIVAAELNPDGAEKRKEKDRKRKAAKSNTTESEIQSHLKTSGGVVTNPDKPAKEKDPDPAPNPPTNRKTATGSEKPSEESKPRTATITPGILPGEVEMAAADKTADCIAWMQTFELPEVVTMWLGTNGLTDKQLAQALHKAADKLDPPDDTKAKAPTASSLRAEVDPETMSEEMMLAVYDWVRYKQAIRKIDWRYQSVTSWQKDLRRILKVATQSGEPFVIEALDKAESKGWRGWEQNESNGKANGNGSAHRTTGKPKPTVEGVFGKRRVE